LLLFRCRCSPSLGHKWFGLHDRPRPQSLLALSNHTLTRLQSLLDNPHSADAIPNFHRPDGDLVVSADNNELLGILTPFDLL